MTTSETRMDRARYTKFMTLPAVIDNQDVPVTAFAGDAFQQLHDPFARQREVHLDGGAFTGTIVLEIGGAELAPVTPPNDGNHKENKLYLRVALKKGAGHGFRRASLLSGGEHIGHPVDGLTFPCADLIWMQLMLGSDLLHGLITTQRFQRHLGLKLICKVPALCHSRIPSKVWDTP